MRLLEEFLLACVIFMGAMLVLSPAILALIAQEGREKLRNAWRSIWA